jgi:hypothetical protein
MNPSPDFFTLFFRAAILVFSFMMNNTRKGGKERKWDSERERIEEGKIFLCLQDVENRNSMRLT